MQSHPSHQPFGNAAFSSCPSRTHRNTRSPSLRHTRPITLFLRDRLGEFSTGIDVIAPGVFISAVVPLAIFFAFQKHFEAGLLGGSVK